MKDAEWLKQEEVTVAIVGGGLGGICAGLYLEKVRGPSTRLHYREGVDVWAA